MFCGYPFSFLCSASVYLAFYVFFPTHRSSLCRTQTERASGVEVQLVSKPSFGLSPAQSCQNSIGSVRFSQPFRVLAILFRHLDTYQKRALGLQYLHLHACELRTTILRYGHTSTPIYLIVHISRESFSWSLWYEGSFVFDESLREKGLKARLWEKVKYSILSWDPPI